MDVRTSLSEFVLSKDSKDFTKEILSSMSNKTVFSAFLGTMKPTTNDLNQYHSTQQSLVRILLNLEPLQQQISSFLLESLCECVMDSSWEEGTVSFSLVLVLVLSSSTYFLPFLTF